MKLVHGFGINDVKGDSTKGSTYSHIYYLWKDMIKRCYSEKYQKTHPSYIGTIICDEWKYYSNFKKWFLLHYKNGYELDKDTINGKSKLYSPQTCAFVPNIINMCVVEQKSSSYPMGVTYHKPKKNMINEYKKPYFAQIVKDKKKHHLGSYATTEEAHLQWQIAKRDYLNEIVNMYRNEVDERVIVGIEERIRKLSNDIINGNLTVTLK